MTDLLTTNAYRDARLLAEPFVSRREQLLLSR
jgi:hypothetical protein